MGWQKCSGIRRSYLEVVLFRHIHLYLPVKRESDNYQFYYIGENMATPPSLT